MKSIKKEKRERERKKERGTALVEVSLVASMIALVTLAAIPNLQQSLQSYHDEQYVNSKTYTSYPPALIAPPSARQYTPISMGKGGGYLAP